MRPRLGATLIELLVVIGIIGILMAMFLPALSRARRAAAKLKCETQMSQLASAVRAYVRDFERLPPRSWLPSVDPQSVPLPLVLMRYVGERPKMFACPDDVADFSQRPPPNEGRTFVETERASYSYTPTQLGLVEFDGVAEYEGFHAKAGGRKQEGVGPTSVGRCLPPPSGGGDWAANILIVSRLKPVFGNAGGTEVRLKPAENQVTNGSSTTN